MKPFLVGITGGIGSGKSVVSKILGILGYPVYDADSRAKELLVLNDHVKSGLIRLLGNEAYMADGSPNRKFISNLVFADKEKLTKLNAIVHPAVQTDFMEWVRINQSGKILFKEAAIMFESGSFQQMDAVIAIVSPEPIRVQRIIERDGKSAEEVKAIMSNQLSEKELIERSTYVIRNDERQLITHQVLVVIQKLINHTSAIPH